MPPLAALPERWLQLLKIVVMGLGLMLIIAFLALLAVFWDIMNRYNSFTPPSQLQIPYDGATIQHISISGNYIGVTIREPISGKLQLLWYNQDGTPLSQTTSIITPKNQAD